MRRAGALHEKLHMFPGWEDEEGVIHLALHIGVGCGTVTMLHLGGHQHRWEYVLAGPPVSQSADAEPLAKSGETCVSPEALALVSDIVEISNLPQDKQEDGHSEFKLVSKVTDLQVCRLPSSSGFADLSSPVKALSLPEADLKNLEGRMVQYVPQAVRSKLQRVCPPPLLHRHRSNSSASCGMGRK